MIWHLPIWSVSFVASSLSWLDHLSPDLVTLSIRPCPTVKMYTWTNSMTSANSTSNYASSSSGYLSDPYSPYGSFSGHSNSFMELDDPSMIGHHVTIGSISPPSAVPELPTGAPAGIKRSSSTESSDSSSLQSMGTRNNSFVPLVPQAPVKVEGDQELVKISKRKRQRLDHLTAEEKIMRR